MPGGSFGSLWDAIGLLLSLLGAAFGAFWDALGRPWARRLGVPGGSFLENP